jgi:ectoine hydroxylase-related dioxygenase (phytanoyl-CoA dioxygenase family)
MDATAGGLSQYESEGLIGPFPLLTPFECSVALKDFAYTWHQLPWYKGLHTFESACLDAARRPEVLEYCHALIGDDVLLWGETMMVKVPGEPHRWHRDIETQSLRTVNCWIGIEHVGTAAPMLYVPGSHRWDRSPQQLAADDGIDLLSSEDLGSAARRIDPSAEVRRVAVQPGEFIIFDGATWHATENTGTGTRSALLAQYCHPSAPVRIPKTYAEPVEWQEMRPPCVVVSGSDQAGVNLIVEPQPLSRPLGRLVAREIAMRTRRWRVKLPA